VCCPPISRLVALRRLRSRHRCTQVEGQWRASCTTPPPVLSSRRVAGTRAIHKEEPRRWRALCSPACGLKLRRIGSVAGGVLYTRRVEAVASLVQRYLRCVAPFLGCRRRLGCRWRALYVSEEHRRWCASCTAPLPVLLRRVGSAAGGALYARRAGAGTLLVHSPASSTASAQLPAARSTHVDQKRWRAP